MVYIATVTDKLFVTKLCESCFSVAGKRNQEQNTVHISVPTQGAIQMCQCCHRRTLYFKISPKSIPSMLPLYSSDFVCFLLFSSCLSYLPFPTQQIRPQNHSKFENVPNKLYRSNLFIIRRNFRINNRIAFFQFSFSFL